MAAWKCQAFPFLLTKQVRYYSTDFLPILHQAPTNENCFSAFQTGIYHSYFQTNTYPHSSLFQHTPVKIRHFLIHIKTNHFLVSSHLEKLLRCLEKSWAVRMLFCNDQSSAGTDCQCKPFSEFYYGLTWWRRFNQLCANKISVPAYKRQAY